MTALRWMLVFCLTCGLLLTGCSSGPGPADPPSSWETADGKWWKSGVDTSTVFRNLEDLKAMGIVDAKMASIAPGQISRDQVDQAVKTTLLALYRHDPKTIDSLYEARAKPVINDLSLDGDVREKVRTQFKTKAYEAINKMYREPRRTNEGSGLVYPDSLRSSETSGTVELQVYVNEEGQPAGIEVLESVHPTLDAIAMRATTQMEWQPAFLQVKQEWVPQSSFVRFGVGFRP
jgi:TonB family protein